VNFRNALIALNIAAFVVIAGVVVWRVFSMRRNPEDKQPDNLEQFLPDEDLEGRRLERVAARRHPADALNGLYCARATLGWPFSFAW